MHSSSIGSCLWFCTADNKVHQRLVFLLSKCFLIERTSLSLCWMHQHFLSKTNVLRSELMHCIVTFGKGKSMQLFHATMPFQFDTSISSGKPSLRLPPRLCPWLPLAVWRLRWFFRYNVQRTACLLSSYQGQQLCHRITTADKHFLMGLIVNLCYWLLLCIFAFVIKHIVYINLSMLPRTSNNA